MPRSKENKKRDSVDPDSIKKAVEAVNSTDPDKKISYRDAIKIYHVSLATLSRESKKYKEVGGDSYEYTANYAVKQVFSNEEEKSLVEYILKVAKMQYGLTKKGVRVLAYKFAAANEKKYPPSWDKDKIAGEEWMRGFMKRHRKNLSVRKPEATSLSRSTSFNRTNVNKFFDNLQSVHTRFGPIPPQKIWNLDETGLSTVQSQSKIVAPKGIKQLGSATSAERGSLVTMIAAVNAIGNYIPPMLIFPRVFFKDRMIYGAPPGTVGCANPSGWSNEKLFLKFLDHFIENVKCSRDDRVLLVLDNHESHLSVEALEKASTAGIVMVTFPPHTSNKLQPLDLTLYGPLKTFYNQGVEAWMVNNAGKTFDIYSIAEVLGNAFPRAFTPSNILSGFRCSGIFPLDRAIFSEEDFLGAYVTDREPLNEVITIFNTKDNAAEPQPSSSAAFDTPSSPSNSENISAAVTPTAKNKITELPEEPLAGPSGVQLANIPDPVTPPIEDNSVELQEEPSAGPSGLQHLSTPEIANRKQISGTKFLSPEEVQPFPKAQARKSKKGGRKCGKTMIATDTPEKEEIMRQKSKKKVQAVTKNLSLDKGKKRGNPKCLSAKKSSLKRKRKHRLTHAFESSSDDSQDDVSLASTDDEEINEDSCWFCGNTMADDKGGEKWSRCTSCGRWAHNLCADLDDDKWETYLCDICLKKI